MIISVQPLTGLPTGPFSWGTAVTLCSGSDTQGPEDWKLDGQPLIESVAILGAAFQKLVDRGNRLHRVSFQITKQNADVKTSQARSLTISASLPSRGLLKFQPDTWTGDTGTAYYAIGSVAFSMTQIGISTIERFEIQCGQFTTSPPTALP